jgi:hypothetical protein
MDDIEQITNASGWDAAFDDGKGTRVPVACWALIKNEDGTKAIKGMIPAKWQQFQYCEDFEEFLCYVPAGKPVPGHSSP